MLFDDQIKKRNEREKIALREAFGDMASDMGLRIHQGKTMNGDHRVLKQLLAYLKVSDYVLEDDGLTSPDEQLENILRPRGIMQRKIALRGHWWKLTVGPKLGQDKEGNMLLFLPKKWMFGYNCINNKGEKASVNEQLMLQVQHEALAFYPALPVRELAPIDLIKFALSVLPSSAILALLAASLVVALFGLFIPFINKQLFDSVIPNGIVRDLYPVAALLVGVIVGSALFEVVRNKLIFRVKDILGIHLQTAVMARIFTLNNKFFWKYSSGEIANRVTSIRMLCSFANQAILGTLLTLLFSVIYIFQILVYAKSLLLPSVIVLAVQSILLVVYAVQLHKEETKLIQHQSQLDGILYNLFSGIQKIKLTGSERRAYTRWMEAYRKCAHITYNPKWSVKLMPALLALCSVGSIVLIYYFAIITNLGLSDFIAFTAAYGMISVAMAAMTEIIPQLVQISPLLNIAEPVLKSVPEVTPNAPQVQFLSGAIEISDLSFRYSTDSNWLFRNFNLKIESGAYVAFVGESGCGKSTLIRLLLGFEQPQSGGVFYDNYDLWKCDKVSLRRQIGTCLQDGNLFAGDIFSNITITAPWSTIDDAWHAAELAGIADDIREMPMQMHTVISEGLGGFSGGQKQRILIARALINRPQIVFFDEATSALDNISQRKISDNLDSLNCTRVVVAHRLSTVKKCNQIIFLEHGRILEQGSYETLMAKKGRFYDMAVRQL
jgi:NHLM bacteriocin system ABC transporter ATP-binding protein